MATIRIRGKEAREIDADDFFCDDNGTLVLVNEESETIAIVAADQWISAERLPEKPN